MPPRSAEIPTALKPFVTHGVEFPRVTAEEANGVCPFCGSGAFFVGLVTVDDKKFAGGWSCHKCSVGPHQNVYGFLRRVWELALSNTRDGDYESLSASRGVSVAALRHYGLAVGPSGDWVAPAYGTKGTVTNLYRWVRVGAKRQMIPTSGPDLRAGYFRPSELGDYSAVEIVEGVWDACARYDMLGGVGGSGDTVVVGSPGCGAWNEGWNGVCAGRRVSVLFDNDHPKERAGGRVHPSWAGTERTVRLLSRSPEPPSGVSVLQWGPDGYDPDLPDGYDLRDAVVSRNGTAASMVSERVVPAPSEWVSGGSSGSRSSLPKDRLTPLSCTSWDDLRAAWRAAIHWTEEYERGLTFVLSVAAAVNYGKERLWGRLIGEAGTGKTMLCNGVSLSEKYVVTESTIPGLYSGAITKDGKDHSFAARLPNKLWVCNDADTLRTHPAREEIFAQMRDLYSGRGSRALHNGLGSRTYTNMQFGVLFSGTPAIYELDSSDLGARFVDFAFVKPCMAVRRLIAYRSMDAHTGTIDPSSMSPGLKTATRMTAGYLEHLRAKYDGVDCGVHPTEENKEGVYNLAEYVAKIRARPPKNQEEHTDSSEMPTRLCNQLMSVAVYSALVKGQPRIGIGAMETARRVALDTARGRTHEIVRAVVGAGPAGADFRAITGTTRKRAHSEAKYVDYLVDIRVLDRFAEDRYALHPEFRQVYRSVFPIGRV